MAGAFERIERPLDAELWNDSGNSHDAAIAFDDKQQPVGVLIAAEKPVSRVDIGIHAFTRSRNGRQARFSLACELSNGRGVVRSRQAEDVQGENLVACAL